MYNDLGTYFFSKLLIPEGSYDMITDVRGQAEYTNLPKGRYMVYGRTNGYLTANSEWLDVSDNKAASTSVALTPASIVRFELSEQQKQRITGEMVYLSCRIIDLSNKELEPMNKFNVEGERKVFLSTVAAANKPEPTLILPAGRYEIRYQLYQDSQGFEADKAQTPLVTGTAQVELQKRETKAITISQ